MAFLKQASLKIENPEISVDNWIGSHKDKSNVKTASNKIIEYKKIIADFSPEDYLLTHCTIVASVNVEDSPKAVHFGSDKTKKEFEKLDGRKDYFITPETSKYMNANGDSWTRNIIKTSYKTFIGAENYVEHVQDPTLSKGKILDAVLREVDEGKSLFVDILVATSKKHKDLVEKIKTGKLTTLSMGSVVAFTICTRCGRIASDETELCSHIKFLKRNSFISENDGKKRVTAELCGHFLYPDSNKFIEGSWVETPAFKGAVMRNEVLIDAIDKEAFVEKYEPIMNIKSADLRDTASRIISAFQLVDRIQNATSILGKTEDEESVEIKDPKIPEDVDLPEEDVEPSTDDKKFKEEKPKEEVVPEETPTEETPKEEPTDLPATPEPEEAPKEEPETEELPPELKDLGKPPSDNSIPEEELDEKAKQPFDLVKEDIKKTIKEQIKKELLRDLGIELPAVPTQTLQNVNLNDTIVRSNLKNNLNLLRNASKIVNESGIKGLLKKGYCKTDILKIAFMLNKYSINKDVYVTVNDIDFKGFSTFRRFAKEVEKRLNRSLASEERNGLDKLVEDLYLK